MSAKSEEYHRYAQEAQSRLDAEPLAQVQVKLAAAVATWTSLAEREERCIRRPTTPAGVAAEAERFAAEPEA